MNSSLRTARGAGSGAGSGQGLQLLHSSLEGYANLLNRRLQVTYARPGGDHVVMETRWLTYATMHDQGCNNTHT